MSELIAKGIISIITKERLDKLDSLPAEEAVQLKQIAHDASYVVLKNYLASLALDSLVNNSWCKYSIPTEERTKLSFPFAAGVLDSALAAAHLPEEKRHTIKLYYAIQLIERFQKMDFIDANIESKSIAYHCESMMYIGHLSKEEYILFYEAGWKAFNTLLSLDDPKKYKSLMPMEFTEVLKNYNIIYRPNIIKRLFSYLFGLEK